MNLGFLLSFFVLFHLLPQLSAQAYNNPNSTCPDHFKCANLGPMTFPFANFSQPDCGLCMVDCEVRPFPTIKLNPSSGQVFEARSSLKSNILKLHDPVFQKILNNKSSHFGCYLFLYGIFLTNSPSISFTIKSNITLFRCSKTPQLIPVVVDYFNTNHYRKNDSCPDFDLYYRNPKHYNYSLELEFPPPGCSRIHLPVWKNSSEDTDLLQLLTADFELEWHLSDRCYHGCYLKGGRCGIDEKNEFRCANAPKGKNKPKIIVVTAASIGGIALLTIMVFFFRMKFSICNYIEIWTCETDKNKDIEIFLKKCGSLAPKRYHYSDVKKITNSFDNKLGQGGYGSVYKGKLRDGSLVAVKILKESKGNGEEFINEVASISRTSHVNIVTLLGFCVQGHKKALIYEFMANGSLEKFIYGEQALVNRQLEWSTLYRIAVGIARGLDYLHSGCNTRILHFDIKPHNILLDENFCPKISDFGLAKLCTRKESVISTMCARGTIGYIAPEVVCKNIGGISHKSDVYSYGMMVLEMVGGRKNLDAGVDHTSEIYFPHWIYKRLDDGEELCLPGIMNEEEDKQARKMLMVSLWCIQTNPSSRPTISNVLEMLEGPLEALQMPPRPYLYSPSITSSVGSA